MEGVGSGYVSATYFLAIEKDLQNSWREKRQIKGSVIDWYLLKSLKDLDSLPCAHKISHASATALWQNDGLTCPQCLQKTQVVRPDPLLRTLCSLVEHIDATMRRTQAQEMRAESVNLAQQLQLVEYPGKPTTFKPQSDLEGLVGQEQVRYRSDDPEALVQRVALTKRAGETVSLNIEFDHQHGKSLRKFFHQFDLPVELTALGQFAVHRHPQVQALFAILTKHNSFSPGLDSPPKMAESGGKESDATTDENPPPQSELALVRDVLRECLRDPVNGKVLTHAVNLWPCCHKVDEARAPLNVSEAHSALCPQCETDVTRCAEDTAIRNLASSIESFSMGYLKPDPAYPEPAARFVLDSGEWGKDGVIKYQNVNLSSQLTTLSLSFSGDAVEFYLELRCRDDEDYYSAERQLLVYEYFVMKGMNYPEDLDRRLRATTSEHKRLLWEGVGSNNQFFSEDFDRISALIFPGLDS